MPTDELDRQCEAFVQEYGELLLTLLAQELDPKVICTKMGLCAGQQKLSGVYHYNLLVFISDTGWYFPDYVTICRSRLTVLFNKL